MKHFSYPMNLTRVAVAAACLAGVLSSASAALSTQQEPAFQSNPVLNVSNSTPLVMLNFSKDQLLFFKAYNDFTALQAVGAHMGEIQTTYQDYIDYYGYFDNAKCYTYASGVFTPAATVSGYVNPGTPLTSHYCSGQWSGNFLNWSSMSRMDAVRKLLYGGYRSTDTAGTSTTPSVTVLERALLPFDAHSFSKFYNGSDLSQLTPFTSANFNSLPVATTTSFTSSPIPLGYGGSPSQYSMTLTVGSTTSMQVGDQICLYYSKSGKASPCAVDASGNLTNSPTSPTATIPQIGTADDAYIYGGVTSVGSSTQVTILVFAPSASTTSISGDCTSGSPCTWNVANLSSTGISTCSTSDPGLSSGQNSAQVSTPPLLRVVKGNHLLWGANEANQCMWSSELSNTQGGFFGGFGSNGNRAFYSGLASSAENPSQANVGLGSGSNDPGTSSATGTYYVRVVACPGGTLDANETCEVYGAPGNEKPVGLLQQYGESGQIKFGLITGTFDKNISGGVVRKNLPPSTVNGVNTLTDEISSGSTGTGQFLIPTNGGIIQTLNALRPYGFAFQHGGEWLGTAPNGDGCTYQLTDILHSGATSPQINEGNCTSWGAPISESYLEAVRYLAGLSPTTLYVPSSRPKDILLGLPQPAWPTGANVVLDANNYCASLNIMNFNSSIESYDSFTRDGAYYASYSDLNLVSTGVPASPGGADAWTDQVGMLEGISGHSFFIGNSTGSNGDGLCSAKTITNFSQASGLCPEAPAKQGSYMMAGIAYAAHTQRIRNDITVPGTDTSSLKVTTYGVQLASNTPKIQVVVPGGGHSVTLLPAYRLDLGSGKFGGGTLVDFRIVNQSCSADGLTCYGNFYVNWEDSGQGGDFDQDMWGILSYAATSSSVSIYTQIVGLSSANGQGFGYVVNGTSADGPHFHSGGYSFSYTDPIPVATLDDSGATPAHINGSGGCNGCVLGDVRTHVVYNYGTATAKLLNDPMWYASKYGAFVDDPTTPTGAPDVTSKWDKFVNATGAPGSDGTPDDYFYVTNPAQLVSSLQRAFSQIVAKVASGTAAAVVASAGQGSGAVYQAFYEPVHQETITPNRQARWIGTLQALFIGPDGRLYEDTNQDGKLTVGSDNAIVFTYDTSSNVTKFQVDDGSVPLSTPLQDLSALKPIWNARKTLATPTAGTVVQQRGYATGNTSKRYIFTWIDENANGKVSASEIYDFTTAAIPSTDYWFFNLINGAGAPAAAATEAQNIINWVRGQDLTGYRNRTLAYNASDGAAGAATQRLGDIIDSTPSVVATPSQAFDLLYGDQSYGVYRNNNACRRQVVLVGANDGMLHAFNAGFYNVANQAFATSPNTTGCATGSSSTTNNYSLGEEIWAYVPQNLIPHLTWLTKDPPITNGYTHVYYVDGTPRVFDVNLPSVINHTCSGTVNSTTIDCSHWGTIAVVPFRLGGGLVTVDTKGDGSTLRKYHSGYIIMDVTDPEQPPKLLGEVTLPDNELATSSPTVVTIRKPDAGTGDPNSWFLVVGSGPNTRTSVSSTSNAEVFAYDLNALKGTDAQGVTKPQVAAFDTGITNAFAGDLVASDWNLDFQSEGVYFGTEQTTSGADFNGGFFKLQTHAAGTSAPDNTLGAWAIHPMYAASNLNDKPVSIRPTLGVDDNATPYTFFGTGRLFASADLGTTQQQSIFGLKDKSETLSHPTGCSGDANCVLDVPSKILSGGTVQSNGTVTGSSDSATTFTQLVQHASNNCLGTTPPSPCYDGWQLNLSTPAAGDTHSGSERVVSSQTLFGGELFTSSYIPNTSLCGAIGLSNLYAQNYQTGTANPSNAPFGTSTSGTTTTVNLSSQIGAGGLASPPSLIVHPGAGGNGSATLQSCVQTSTGQIVCQNLGSNIGPNNGEVSWRQLLNNN